MSEPNRELIMKALERVIDPELRKPVTELDMVRGVEIDGGDVRVTIALDDRRLPACAIRSSNRWPRCCGTCPASSALRSAST